MTIELFKKQTKSTILQFVGPSLVVLVSLHFTQEIRQRLWLHVRQEWFKDDGFMMGHWGTFALNQLVLWSWGLAFLALDLTNFKWSSKFKSQQPFEKVTCLQSAECRRRLHEISVLLAYTSKHRTSKS